MGDKQLNVWIDSDLKDALAERAKREKKSVTDLTEDILRQDMARQNGEIIEQQALPIIREIVTTEVRKGIAQLLNDLRDELHLDLLEEIKTVVHRSDDRLAKLVVRAIRDAGISRRLVIAHLSKAYGPDFARVLMRVPRKMQAKNWQVKSRRNHHNQRPGVSRR